MVAARFKVAPAVIQDYNRLWDFAPGAQIFVPNAVLPALPLPPQAVVAPQPPAPWPGPLNQPMPPLITLDGSTLPAPTDGTVRAKPPAPPKQP